MTRSDLRKEVEIALLAAKETMETFGEVAPQFIIAGKANRQVLICPFQNDEQRDMTALAITERVHMERCEMLVMVAEAWITRKPTDAVAVRPRDDPARREALTVTGYTRGDTFGVEQYFHRDEQKKLVWDERREGPLVGGRFDPWSERRGR